MYGAGATVTISVRTRLALYYKEINRCLQNNRLDGGQGFWVRRASAVILIPAILHNDYEGLYPYQISDLLMYDGHDLVQKGYGWMLKCLSTADMESVKEYLALRHKEMPRTAFRYALEKFDEK